MAIGVVPYDPEWADQFRAEQAVLERLLAPWLSGGIHHVGSTAIPGLAAKPVIDMVAGVRDLATARAAFPALREHAYGYEPHRPQAHHFRKPAGSPLELRTHHLHLTEPGSDLWRERLAFRDALRADPALLAEYQQLKFRLAERHDDVAAYTADKRAFVSRVLATAGITLPERP